MPKETPPADLAAEIEAIFHPRSIAVVGASANPDTPGYDYLHSLQTFGYAGEIYPVHPRAQEILGLPSSPSLREAPEPVDYVISCIPASAVLDLVDDCAAKGARALQLFTARFSETGRAGGAGLGRGLARGGQRAVWDPAVVQAGAVPVDTVEELIDMLLAFAYMRPLTLRPVRQAQGRQAQGGRGRPGGGGGGRGGPAAP